MKRYDQKYSIKEKVSDKDIIDKYNELKPFYKKNPGDLIDAISEELNISIKEVEKVVKGIKK